MLKPLISAAFCLCAATASAATFECAMKPGSGDRDFIPGTVRLSYDASGKATVLDEFIQARHGGPIAATFQQRDGSSVQLSWEVEVTYKRNRTSQADFRIILRPGSGRASMTVHVPGNIEPSQAKGNCRPIG